MLLIYLEWGRKVLDIADRNLLDGDAANLNSGELWAAIARLQWAVRSDREIRPRDINTLVADLRGDGVYEATRRALRLEMAALVAVYPSAAVWSAGVLAQIVALGRDQAIAAAAAPDLFDYYASDLQKIDLARLMRVYK